MERRLILRGFLAGAVGGLLAFVFARIFAEPLIDRAIAYEEGRAAAQEALDRAAGYAIPAEEAGEVVSRAVQSGVGIGLGMVFFGLLIGGLYAVTYALCLGRTGRIRPRPLALAVALAGFVVVYLVPFLKYPANPPAVGNDATVGDRTGLYLLLLGISVVAAVVATAFGQAVRPRLGTWNATLAGAAAYAVAVGVAMAVLPSLGELSENVAQNGGPRATETPLPLRDADDNIAFPGFPADVLAEFRVYAVGAQLVLWTALGLAFAPMADRLLARDAEPRPTRPRAQHAAS
jgi:predicted cobalt transporter CbtA